MEDELDELRKKHGLDKDKKKEEMEDEKEEKEESSDMNQGEEEEEEEDEIVEEIDVFFSNTMNDNLHIFQYPLRPNWRPYERKESDEVYQKDPPLSFSVNYNLDRKSESYSQFSNHLIHQFTVSSNKVPINSHYALAKIHNCKKKKKKKYTNLFFFPF